MYIWEKRYNTAMLYRYPKSKKYPYEIKSLQKQGIPGQFKEKQNNDKNTLHLPRQCLRDAVKALILLDFLWIIE